MVQLADDMVIKCNVKIVSFKFGLKTRITLEVTNVVCIVW